MADVSVSVRFEDMPVLLDDPGLSPDLRQVLENPERAAELKDTYEVELSEAEAVKLRAHAEARGLRQLAEALRVELNGLASKRRPPRG